jgi:hypothetical protein
VFAQTRAVSVAEAAAVVSVRISGREHTPGAKAPVMPAAGAATFQNTDEIGSGHPEKAGHIARHVNCHGFVGRASVEKLRHVSSPGVSR